MDSLERNCETAHADMKRQKKFKGTTVAQTRGSQ
jgi:hypothetical protein